MDSNRQMTMSFQLKVKRVWIHGFLIGLLSGALGFGVCYSGFSMPFLPSDDPPSTHISAENQASATVSKESKVDLPNTPNAVKPLKIQLAQVLEAIRDRTQKKDLSGLMSLYSPSFPQLSDKTQDIKKSWRLFEYPKMDFEVLEAKAVDASSAVARVTWHVAVKNLTTHKSKALSKTYQVTFRKEDGQWHILGLQNAQR